MRATVQRAVLFAACLLCLALAIVGLLLPLVPTTPFLLLAAWFAARSSQRLHRWLVHSPGFGPILRDWEERGAVRRRTKILATVLMVGLISYPVYFLEFALTLKLLAGATVLGVLGFLWTRPAA